MPLARSVHLLYRARTFLPTPLEVIEPHWLEFSQLGDAFDPPPGSWDEVERTPDGSVLRTIHRPRLGWTYHCTARSTGAGGLALDVRVKKGRSPLVRLTSRETIFETDDKTGWDVEWLGDPGQDLGKVAGGTVVRRLTRELAAEVNHREHVMVRAVAQTPWGRAELARSEPLSAW